MASLASINIKFSADLAGFSKQMQNVNRQMSGIGKKLQNTGAGLSSALTLPLTAFGGLAVKAFADLETLKTSLDTVFKGDQELSNKAFDQIKEFSSTTPFQLNEVSNAFVKLKNLGLNPSIESLTSYGNTASALGKSLDQMIEAVADASVGEFERLKEFGIKAKSQGDNVSFTFQGVTTTVKKNSEEIEEYLTNIGNVQFAGSIDRQAQTFKGKLSTLKDNIAQAFAGIGEIIVDYITPLFEKINSLVTRFNDLSPATKKFIVILGGIAAAIGPLLALAGTILPAIGTGFALLTGPIGLIVAGLTAIGVIIYKNWKPIKKTLIDIANYFVELYNESTAFRIGVEAVALAFKNMFEVGKFAFETLKNIISSFIDSFTNGFKTFGKVFKAAITGNFSEIPEILKQNAAESKAVFSGFTKDLAADWKNLTNGIKQNGQDAIDAIVKRKKIAFVKENIDATAIKEKVSEAVAQGLAEGGSGQVGGRPQITPLETSVESEGIAQIPSPLDSITTQLPNQLALVDEQLTAFKALMVGFGNDVSGIIEGTAENFIVGFGNIIAGIASGMDPAKGLVKLILTTIGDLLQQLGKAAIKIGLTMKAIKLSFSNPLTAIVAGTAAVILGGLIKSFVPKDLQAFQDGGIVGGNSFYGDKILARVNSGELILNETQQHAVFQAMNQQPAFGVALDGEFKLTGEDLILSVDRTNKRLNRNS